MNRRLWVVAYDITDDRKRAAVRRILSDHGKRVQYSVFECWLDDEGEDHVRYYGLCSKDVDGIQVDGPGTITTESDDFTF